MRDHDRHHHIILLILFRSCTTTPSHINQPNQFIFFVIFTATNAIKTEKESSNLVHPISFTLYHIISESVIIFNINATPLLVNLARKDDPCKNVAVAEKNLVNDDDDHYNYRYQ